MISNNRKGSIVVYRGDVDRRGRMPGAGRIARPGALYLTVPGVAAGLR